MNALLHLCQRSSRLIALGCARLTSLLIGLLFTFVGALLPTLTHAQDLEGMAVPDGDAVARFFRLIRWGGVFSSVLVLITSYLFLRLLRNTIENLSAQFTTRRLLFQKIETIIRFSVYVGTVIGVLMLSLRIDDRVLALIGGTVAVSVGFAVKDLVASFIAGITIMVDRPFQVGDRVDFGGQYGDITAIGLRSVRMQTLDDNTVTIPNNKFLSDITSCGNYGALDMQVGMNFVIGLDQDVDLARQICTEAAVSSRYIFLPKPVVVLVTQVIEDSHLAIRLRLKAYVNDTRHEKAFETDVNLRVLRAFRDNHIKPPSVLHRAADMRALSQGLDALATDATVVDPEPVEEMLEGDKERSSLPD